MNRIVSTEIEIKALEKEIWETLIDFKEFSSWNPFMESVKGVFKEGAQLDVTINPPLSPKLTFHPVITTIEPYREFRWIGHAIHPKLLLGEHIFRLEKIELSSTKFIHVEIITGRLAPLFCGPAMKSAEMGFDKMNRALKLRVEGGSKDQDQNKP
jgi:hypothetical protein